MHSSGEHHHLILNVSQKQPPLTACRHQWQAIPLSCLHPCFCSQTMWWRGRCRLQWLKRQPCRSQWNLKPWQLKTCMVMIWEMHIIRSKYYYNYPVLLFLNLTKRPTPDANTASSNITNVVTMTLLHSERKWLAHIWYVMMPQIAAWTMAIMTWYVTSLSEDGSPSSFCKYVVNTNVVT